MDPIGVGDARLLRETGEMPERRLVASRHFGGHDEIGAEREAFESAREEVVIAIGQHGELPAGLAQGRERRADIGEERHLAPFADQHVGLAGGERQPDLPRRALQCRNKHILVEPVRALGLDRGLGLVIGRDERRRARSGDRLQRLPVAGPPIDERSEAVEGDPALLGHGFSPVAAMAAI